MSDSLKQAVEGLEIAWRRLREVLDGPDVAAALVERRDVRPMSTAPRDGTWVHLHFKNGTVLRAQWRSADARWTTGTTMWASDDPNPIGWSLVKPDTNQWPRPMSTAPRHGKPVVLHRVGGGRIQALYNVAYQGWVDQQNDPLSAECSFIGWSPVKPEVQPMSTAPRDGTEVNLHFGDGRYVKAEFHKENGFWMDRCMCEPAGTPIGWSPVK